MLRLSLVLSFGVLAACSSLLNTIFDIPPPDKPVVHAKIVRGPRRTPFVDTGPPGFSKEYLAMMEELDKAGPATKWDEVFKRLPQDDDANIDWMTALRTEVIKPSGTIDPTATDEGQTSDDEVEMATSAKHVVFSHATHTQWLTCSNCHNAIFKRKGGSTTVTMKAIDDGKYCGVCHDKVALAQPAGCKGCHKTKKKES